MGVLKMGTVALDGTKIHANASRHELWPKVGDGANR
jgi:transposase